MNYNLLFKTKLLGCWQEQHSKKTFKPLTSRLMTFSLVLGSMFLSFGLQAQAINLMAEDATCRQNGELSWDAVSGSTVTYTVEGDLGFMTSLSGTSLTGLVPDNYTVTPVVDFVDGTSESAIIADLFIPLTYDLSTDYECGHYIDVEITGGEYSSLTVTGPGSPVVTGTAPNLRVEGVEYPGDYVLTFEDECEEVTIFDYSTEFLFITRQGLGDLACGIGGTCGEVTISNSLVGARPGELPVTWDVIVNHPDGSQTLYDDTTPSGTGFTQVIDHPCGEELDVTLEATLDCGTVLSLDRLYSNDLIVKDSEDCDDCIIVSVPFSNGGATTLTYDSTPAGMNIEGTSISITPTECTNQTTRNDLVDYKLCADTPFADGDYTITIDNGCCTRTDDFSYTEQVLATNALRSRYTCEDGKAVILVGTNREIVSAEIIGFPESTCIDSDGMGFRTFALDIGTYDLEITDVCGNTNITNYELEDRTWELGVDISLGCGKFDVRIKDGTLDSAFLPVGTSTGTANFSYFIEYLDEDGDWVVLDSRGNISFGASITLENITEVGDFRVRRTTNFNCEDCTDEIYFSQQNDGLDFTTLEGVQCTDGGSYTINALSIGADPITYTITETGATLTVDSGESAIFTDLDEATYTVTASNECGTQVRNIELVNLPPFMILGESSYCVGSDASLSIGGFEFLNFDWSGPNGNTGTGSTLELTNLTADDEGTYTLNLTDSANDCIDVTLEFDLVVDSPDMPAVVDCWDDFELDSETCEWENVGSQPDEPEALECWDDYQFDTTLCEWVNEGSEPVTPTFELVGSVFCFDEIILNIIEGEPFAVYVVTSSTGAGSIWTADANGYVGVGIFTQNDGTNPIPGEYTRTLTQMTVGDCIVPLNISETYVVERPEAICQDFTVQLDASGNASITATDIDNGSGANTDCEMTSMSIDMMDFDCSHEGENTVTLSVSDVGGVSSTCTATVTVLLQDEPLAGECWDDYQYDSEICDWVNEGSEALVPVLTIDNPELCEGEVVSFTITGSPFVTYKGTYEPGPSTPDGPLFNITADANGIATFTAPAVPSLLFSTATISSILYANCIEGVIISATYEVITPEEPEMVNCWDEFELDLETCTYVNVGVQPVMPLSLNCWDDYQFDTDLCEWVNEGSEALDPVITIDNPELCEGEVVSFTITGSPFVEYTGFYESGSPGPGGPSFNVTADANGIASFTAPASPFQQFSTATILNIKYANCNYGVSIPATYEVCETPLISGCAGRINTQGPISYDNDTDGDGIWENCDNTICSGDEFSVSVGKSSNVAATTIEWTLELDQSNPNLNVSLYSPSLVQVSTGNQYQAYLGGIVNSSSTTQCFTIDVTAENLDCGTDCSTTITLEVCVLPEPVEPPIVNCWDDFQIDGETCLYVNVGSQPDEPEALNCWDDFQFDTTLCDWVNEGSEPVTPTITLNQSTYCFDNVIEICVSGDPNANYRIDIPGFGGNNVITDSNGNKCYLRFTDNNGTNPLPGMYDVIISNGIVGNCVTPLNVVVPFEVERPEAICQDLTVQLDASGNASITAADIDNGSGENTDCAMTSMSIDMMNFDCSHEGDNTVTLSVSDVGGVSSTCTATVTVLLQDEPAAVDCWDDYQYDSELCDWVNEGSEALVPVLTIDNPELCEGEVVSFTITGSPFVTYKGTYEPGPPTPDGPLFNITADANGIATFTAPAVPNQQFSTATIFSILYANCVDGVFISATYEVITPDEPAVVNCWDDFELDLETCTWVNLGSQPDEPEAVECWDDYQFDTDICEWVNEGAAMTSMSCATDYTLQFTGDTAMSDAITSWLDTATATDECGDPTGVTSDYDADNFSECNGYGIQVVTFTSSDGLTCSAILETTFDADTDCTGDWFEPLATGTIVDTQIPGVTVFGHSTSTTANMAMIFDSGNPTGGDNDLGPIDFGQILIISEDGDSSDPDDDTNGGTFEFDFDNDQYITSLSILDIEEAGGSITLSDSNGAVIGLYTLPVTGNAGYTTVSINTGNVSLMEVHLMGSGAITDYCAIEMSGVPTCIDDEGQNCNEAHSETWNSGYGHWKDGGSDCRLDKWPTDSTNDCVRLRDDSNSSKTTTINQDFSASESLEVAFDYYPKSMENNEDFFLEYSTNGGSNYTVAGRWIKGTDFNNDQAYSETVVILDDFTSNTKLRFRCDASGNGDFIYLDNIVVTECSSTSSSDCTGEITLFELNPQDGSPLITLTDGQQFTSDVFASSDVRIRATATGEHESLEFTITRPDGTTTNIENVVTYDSHNFWATVTGTYTINAKLYKDANASGDLCDEQTITFDIISNCTGEITLFEINPQDGSPLVTLADGDVLCEDDYDSSDVRIRATAIGEHESLEFHITRPDGTTSNLENVVTYDSDEFWIEPGTYTINAKLYKDPNATGDLCDEETITITVQDSNICGNSYRVADIDNNIREEISIYPNPSSDFIQVKGLGSSSYRVFDSSGKILIDNFKNPKLSIQDLENGIYYLKATDGRYIRFIKI